MSPGISIAVLHGVGKHFFLVNKKIKNLTKMYLQNYLLYDNMFTAIKGERKMKRKPIMIIKIITKNKVINTIKLQGQELINRALTYLSGAYGEVVDKHFEITKDHSTTFTFKVMVEEQNAIFDTTIENFDLFLY